MSELGQESLMRRRHFIALLGGTLGTSVLWPVGTRAQRQPKIWLIGFIAHEYEPMYDAFFDGLRELGYIEAQNIAIERRYAEGQPERFKKFASEMVELRPDVIVTVTTPAVLAIKNATTTVPIVIPNAIDAVGAGLVASLNHPGGNVTGGTLLQAELSLKRLELLKEMVPGLSRAALLWNAGNPAYVRAWTQSQGAAQSLGVALQRYEVRESTDFQAAFAKMAQQHPDALVVLEDAMTIRHRKEIVDLALKNNLPSSFFAKEAVQAGGLMSYGANWPDAFRRGATTVDKILKGAKPSELPVEQPTKFELAINLKTAQALGLKVPTSLLATADEVVE
jgi:putative tryptophan/tyrosine transport system substrate-binding protein